MTRDKIQIKELTISGYEKVIEGIDLSTGLHCYIAIHNTELGPSLGGTRIYPYETPEEALNDALLLSKSMTYKSALVENGLGGGKAVIIADPHKDKTEELLLSFAQVVDSLNGLYIAAEDLGSTTEDIAIVSRGTKYVAALQTETSSGDPSRFTAWGIFRGIQAVATNLWGSPNIHGKKIAIQGVGNVGEKLARMLFWHGAELYITDVIEEKIKELSIRYGGKIISPNTYVETVCDILCPCAMGGMINETTINQLKCKAIAGSANNQLTDEKLSLELSEKGILYAPDYVINAGGIINAASEFAPTGYDPKASRDKVEHIYTTLMTIFETAQQERTSTIDVANSLAEYKLRNQIGKRKAPMIFHGT